MKPGESRYCVSGSVAAGAFRFVGDGVRPSSASTIDERLDLLAPF